MDRPGGRIVVHLLFARCAPESAAMQAMETALHAAAEDSLESRVTRVSTIDLSAGPQIGRVRAAFGFGWQAREWLRRVEQASGAPVDVVVEACPGDRHHLLGLGRVGVPAVRWTGDAADRRWVDTLAAQEGAIVLPEAVVPPDARAVVRLCLEALDVLADQLQHGLRLQGAPGKA